jgi:hypothetical protein
MQLTAQLIMHMGKHIQYPAPLSNAKGGGVSYG